MVRGRAPGFKVASRWCLLGARSTLKAKNELHHQVSGPAARGRRQCDSPASEPKCQRCISSDLDLGGLAVTGRPLVVKRPGAAR